METIEEKNLPPRVLSGVQPSGTLHIGNYFGALQQHIRLQEEYPGECYYFIADYHALTSVRNPEVLRKNVFDLAATYMALGLDTEKAVLFRQSDVPEVTELTWLLATVTGMGLLERAHSYKEKVSQSIKPTVGLFAYPVLMAADILIYDSSIVPVGKDQIQHIEMTQDMATRFNETYGKGGILLRRPEYKLSHAPYVPGLDGQKMSKSYDNTIPMFLPEKKMRKLISKIVTDSTPLGHPLSSENCTIFRLISLFATKDELDRVKEWYKTGKKDGADFGYGHAKLYLAEKIQDHFSESRQRREALHNDPQAVENMLKKSAEKARRVARKTLDRCRRACGIAQ